MTTDIKDIMDNLDRLEAYKCLGRMSDDLDKYEHELYLKSKVMEYG